MKTYEKKNLVANFNGSLFAVEVQPVEQNDKIIFELNLGDNNPKTIEHTHVNGWWQLSGNQIYTDLLHSIGAVIEKNYPELF